MMAIKNLLFLLRLMMLLNICLTVTLIYFIWHTPMPQKFASNPSGKSTPLYALTEPLLSQASLLAWANQAAISVYNFNYVNYPQQFKIAASYFTSEGWDLFRDRFQKVVDSVIEKKLQVSAVVTGTPLITQQGPLMGHYTWRIRMPLLVTYESGSQKLPQHLIVEMLVIRVATTQTPKGIAIAQFVTTQSLEGNMY